MVLRLDFRSADSASRAAARECSSLEDGNQADSVDVLLGQQFQARRFKQRGKEIGARRECMVVEPALTTPGHRM